MNEEQKAANIPDNQDESVRLQEPEIEEIEQKSNRDKDSNKVTPDQPKIQEKVEEVKNMVKSPPENGNQKESNINPTPNFQPNAIELETSNKLQEKPEIYQTKAPQNPYGNWNPAQQETQRQAEAQIQMRAQAQKESVEGRESRTLPTNVLQNLIQNAPNIRNQYQQVTNTATTISPPLTVNPQNTQYYARQTSASAGIPVMSQGRQVLPTSSKISFGADNTNIRPMMSGRYVYGIPAQPAGYVSVNNFPTTQNRLGPNGAQLPAMNQFPNLLNNPQFAHQANPQQIPSAYLHQAQLKNLMMANQGGFPNNSVPRMDYQNAYMAARGNPTMNKQLEP